MKIKSLFILMTFLCLLVISIPQPVFAQGSVSTDKVFLPNGFYKDGNYSLDTSPNKPDMFNFTVVTPDGATIWVSWRHNSASADIIIASNQTGFIAVSWKPIKPDPLSINNLLNGSNVIVGSNNTVQDVTDHFNLTYNSNDKPFNNVVNSTIINNNQGIRIEFVYKLANSQLLPGEVSYLMFATGSSLDLDTSFNLSTTAFYVPDGYVGTWMDVSYPDWLFTSSNSLPFGDSITVLFAIALLPVIRSLKKNLR